MLFISVGFFLIFFFPFSDSMLLNNERKNIGYLSLLPLPPLLLPQLSYPKAHIYCAVSIVRPAIYIVRYTIHFPNYNPIIVYSSKIVVCMAVVEELLEKFLRCVLQMRKIIPFDFFFSALPAVNWKF